MHFSKLLSTKAALAIIFIACPWAAAVDVSTEQQLRAAIANGAASIDLTADITLSAPLPIISGGTSISGNGHSVNANDAGRVFFVNAPAGEQVLFSGLTIQNGRARGGNGGTGSPPGGGGLGAGSALFVNSGDVSLLNVNFQNNRALGGAGGDFVAGNGGGGGGLGGNGGNGGNGGIGSQGGGGGGAVGFIGGGPAIPGSGGGGGGGSRISPGQSGSGSSGRHGGDGGSGGFGGGGGGGGAAGSASSPTPGGLPGSHLVGGGRGGSGGDFGGGGGGGGGSFGTSVGGVGGFGGGGGGNSGGGGYGGGNSGGGGGSALGGAIFVRSGATLTIQGGLFAGNDVTGGAAGAGGGTASPPAGAAKGEDMHLMATVGLTITGPDDITFPGGISGDAGDLGLTKSGAGTLTLGGANTYTGGTRIDGGRLVVSGSIGDVRAGGGPGPAILAGNGQAATVVLDEGGALAPGDSIGTFAAQSLQWNAGATLWFDLGEGSSDQLLLSGDLVKGGGSGPFAFVFTGDHAVAGETYTLATFADTNFVAGDFSIAAGGNIDGIFTLSGNALRFTMAPEQAPAFVVTVPDDHDGENTPGKLTLRQAIRMANEKPGPDTIVFAPHLTGTITLQASLGPLNVSDPLTLEGPGTRNLAISGGDASRIIEFSGSGPHFLSGLTLRNGRAANGGAIHNLSVLDLVDCAITGSSALASSGSAAGGGIWNGGRLNVSRCSFSGNSARAVAWGLGGAAGMGGALYNHDGGSALLENSTFHGNSGTGGKGFPASGAHTIIQPAGRGGTGCGGIWNRGNMTLRSCTLAKNGGHGGPGGTGIPSGPNGSAPNGPAGRGIHGIMHEEGVCHVENTICADSIARERSDFISGGFNLLAGGLDLGFDLPSDGQAADPLLGPLQDNGGPTDTMLPLPGSLALDRGHSAGLLLDQRRRLRLWDDPATANAPGSDGTDIGAVEVQPATSQPISLEAWRALHFGELANSALAADETDADGDGASNFDEYLAGTDPRAAADVFRILSATRTGNGFTLVVPGKAGRIYRLFRNDDLNPATWQPVPSATAGPLAEDGIVTLTDPAATSARAFYRATVTGP